MVATFDGQVCSLSMGAYLFLLLAILSEVTGTCLLKASLGFTRIWPSAGSIIFYLLAFYLAALAMKGIPVAVAYAIWSGLGLSLVVLIGAVVFQERPDLPALLGIGLIIAGLVVMQLWSKTTRLME